MSTRSPTSVFWPQIKIKCGIFTPRSSILLTSYVQHEEQLLARSRMQALAWVRDLEELITGIKNAAYANIISGVWPRHTTEGIEWALRGDW